MDLNLCYINGFSGAVPAERQLGQATQRERREHCLD